MSFQLIITYLVVLSACGYTIYQFAKLFKKKASACGHSCSSCSFKKELRTRGIPKQHNYASLRYHPSSTSTKNVAR